MIIETLILQWIHKYKGGGNKNDFYKTFDNKGIINLIYYLFEKQPEHELLGPVCRQLYEQYKGICQELRLQSIHLIPSLVMLYLESYTDEIVYASVEAFILGVYNMDCVDNDGAIRHDLISIPDISSNSIYHRAFATSALPQLKEEPVKIELSYKCCKRMDSTNRFQILSRVLNIFNRNISSANMRCKAQYCRIARRFVSRGFDSEYDENISSRGVIQRRFLLKPMFLLEIIDGLYYVLFNGQSRESHQTFVAVLRRAKYELYPTVIMVTIAVLEDLSRSKRKMIQKSKPVSTKIIKRYITNASFRSKKLPEDITVTNDDMITNSMSYTNNYAKEMLKSSERKANAAEKDLTHPRRDLGNNKMDDSVQMYMNSVIDSHEPYSSRPYMGHNRDVAQEGVATAALAAASLLPTEQILQSKNNKLKSQSKIQDDTKSPLQSVQNKTSQSKKQQFKSVIRAPFKRGDYPIDASGDNGKEEEFEGFKEIIPEIIFSEKQEEQ